MTNEEKLAYEYGRTFDTSTVPEGFSIACCFDKRMNALVSNSRSETGKIRNHRNMKAWYKGLTSVHTNG